jgi:signal transduction histidine kinase
VPDEPAPDNGLAESAQQAFEAMRRPADAEASGVPAVLTPRALALQDTQRRELFAALRIPIITTSMSGQVSNFNAAAISLFGSPARLYNHNIRDLLPFVPLPGEATAAGDAQGTVADATGQTVDIEVSRTVLSEHDDHNGYAVYVVHDISRHAEVNRLREQLLYSVAHELRGPLMVLDNALEILDTEYPRLSAEEYEQVLGTARRTARRMRTLMEDLLSAGSIQSGHFVVAPRRTELESIIMDALEIVNPSIEGRGQCVELALPEEPAMVLADQRYARQVLTNLLANASKYSPERSVIRLLAEPNANMVRISVVDQGPGIPPEQQAGLFERFYRVRSDTDVPGVGLGLAIAKGIVEAHGGSIGIESEVGSGTNVWFTLPGASRQA